VTDPFLWQRLCSLKPSLPHHIHIQERPYQGETWYVLHDKSTGRFHRLTPAAFDVLGLMDGHRTLADIHDQLVQQHPDGTSPTREDILHLVQYLHVADLLICDLPAKTADLFARQQKKRHEKWKRLITNPLTWHVPLGNPDKWLTALAPFMRWLISPVVGVIWLSVVALAIVQACVHWPALTTGSMERLFSPANLLMLWLTYPLFKCLHELGHGLFTKLWGGQVNEWGVVFVVGTPLPYVDATAATGFVTKKKRLMVTAAGMAVELFLAATALLVWIQLNDGFLRDFLFNIIVIGSVSTLFFNGNPLMRFDGYHLLTDAIDQPNLASRATLQLNYVVKRFAFGIERLTTTARSMWESVGLVSYAVAALIYRIAMLLFIILIAIDYAPQLGVVIGVWLIGIQVVWPLVKGMVFLGRDRQLTGTRTRAVGVSGGVLAALLAVLFWLPLPESTSIEGIVWLPDAQRVKVQSSGVVVSLAIPSGEHVQAGDVIAILDNPTLRADLAVVDAKIIEVEARYQHVWVSDRVQALAFEEDLAALRSERHLLAERVAHLEIKAPSSGRFRRMQSHQLTGSFLQQGQEIGIIETGGTMRVRAVATQDEIGLIRESTRSVNAALTSDIARTTPMRLTETAPISTYEVPHPALGTTGGGRIALLTDPSGIAKTPEPVFVVEVVATEDKVVTYFGERVFVHFEHAPSPLFTRLWRHAKQLLIREFS
jgi:putative peptide zinc metalloprotease protein